MPEDFIKSLRALNSTQLLASSPKLKAKFIKTVSSFSLELIQTASFGKWDFNKVLMLKWRATRPFKTYIFTYCSLHYLNGVKLFVCPREIIMTLYIIDLLRWINVAYRSFSSSTRYMYVHTNHVVTVFWWMLNTEEMGRGWGGSNLIIHLWFYVII